MEHEGISGLADASEDLVISRRTLAAGAAWSMPAIVAIGAALPVAASTSSGPSYATTATGSPATTPPVWTNVPNATVTNPPPSNGSYANWSSGANAAIGTLTLSGFPNVTKHLTSGETLLVKVRHFEAPTDFKDIASVTVSLYNNGKADLLWQSPLTLAATAAEPTLTYLVPANTNLTLTNVTVEVKMTRAANSNGKVVQLNVDWVSLQHIHAA